MTLPVGRRLSSWAHDAFFRSIHQRHLVYNACWEDPRVDRALLQLDNRSKVVVITSAGCNTLHGAEVLMRSAGLKLDFLPNFVRRALRFFPDWTARLHALDRVGTYGSTHPAEVV